MGAIGLEYARSTKARTFAFNRSNRIGEYDEDAFPFL